MMNKAHKCLEMLIISHVGHLLLELTYACLDVGDVVRFHR
jgi:hypothetical protein